MLEKIQETAAFLKGKMHTSPETAIILGTGLGSLANEITEKYEIKYKTGLFCTQIFHNWKRKMKLLPENYVWPEAF